MAIRKPFILTFDEDNFITHKKIPILVEVEMAMVEFIPTRVLSVLTNQSLLIIF